MTTIQQGKSGNGRLPQGRKKCLFPTARTLGLANGLLRCLPQSTGGTVMLGKECPVVRAQHLTRTTRTFRKRVWSFCLATSQLGRNGCCNRIGFCCMAGHFWTRDGCAGFHRHHGTRIPSSFGDAPAATLPNFSRGMCVFICRIPHVRGNRTRRKKQIATACWSEDHDGPWWASRSGGQGTSNS
jgi:hypothetical protein